MATRQAVQAAPQLGAVSTNGECTVIQLDEHRSALLHPRAIDALLIALRRSKERGSLSGWRSGAEFGRSTGARC
jgi:hypothetical protein